ncbi:hypothetical protein [uncultured Maribacter sp.]|uniref:hypothetical protein n=1 Tax=uncultured Maribacter sp. TaxID=431308 RepID=UPI0026148060|nr:hypothetical protein [uncultured Maribacter sp.]
MNKIEINNNVEELERISTFLKNNHIKHDVVENRNNHLSLEELVGSINFPI